MRIPIEQIFPDPDHPTVNRETTGKEPVRSTRAMRDPVVVKDGGLYRLFAGERRFRAARDAGEHEIECQVRDDLTDQEKWELQLAELYHSSAVPPMELGRAFINYRDVHDVTQQELARRTGITPGTIHHYESLIRTLDPDLGEKVDRGDLTFKEGRSIADIEDHARQREIAEPFLTGRLSSVHVERVVGRAKQAPNMPVEQIIEEVVNGRRAPEPEPRVEPVRVEPEPVVARGPELIENTVLRLAGELDALQLQTIPEFRRLKLISSLRILDSRLKAALVHLNGGQARNLSTPRPFTTAATR